MRKYGIIKIIALYLIFYIVLSAAFATIYYYINTSTSWFQWFITSLAASINCPISKTTELLNNDLVRIIQVLIGQVGFVILTGFLLAAVLNINAYKVKLANNIIIRKTANHGTVLSLLVLNKNKYSIYNVEVGVRVVKFEKTEKEYKGKTLYNSVIQTKRIRKISEIENYFRFSFPVKMLPDDILKNILNMMPKKYKSNDIKFKLEDYPWKISVTVAGILNGHGGHFLLKQNYDIRNIIIAEGSEPINNIIYDDDKVKSTKCNWDNAENINMCKDLESIIGDIRRETGIE